MGPRDHPGPTSLKDAAKLYACGFLMGTADLVPGVSGGTLAFLTGIYSDLIHSISSIHLGRLATFQVRKFFQEIAWLYLLIVLAGMATAIFSLAHFIRELMDDPVCRSYLYSAFLGFIAASAVICLRRLGGISRSNIWPLLAGVAIAIAGTWNMSDAVELDLSTLGLIQPMTIACGALAICAMMLPGVSGSYVLHMLGMYQATIEALAEVQAMSSLLYLGNLAVGIGAGGLLFSKLVTWLLDHYHASTFAILTGLMVGALPTLWPGNTNSPIWLIVTGAVSFALVLLVEHYALHLRRLKNSSET